MANEFKLVKLLDAIQINIDNDGLLNNLTAVTDPTVNDDSDDGYAVGSKWINTSTDQIFYMTDSTVGASNWVNVSESGTDIAVKVSSDDTNNGQLEDKIVAGTNITLTTLNPGGNETLEISASGGGGSGAGASLQSAFDTSTTSGDPGSGNFRLDNATPASVTSMFINDTTDNGADVGEFLVDMDKGNRIYIQQSNDATKYIHLSLTAKPQDNGGWWNVAGTPVDSSTLFDSTEECAISFETPLDLPSLNVTTNLQNDDDILIYDDSENEHRTMSTTNFKQFIKRGLSSGMAAAFNTSTTAADPGATQFRMNNSTPASVTALYIDDIAKSGAEFGYYLDELSVGDLIFISDLTNHSNYLALKVTSVTDNTGWYTVGVTVEDSSSLFTAGADCAFSFGFAAGGGGGTVNDLQDAYDGSTAGEIVVDGTRGSLRVEDNATPIAAPLFEVTDNGNSTSHFMVHSDGYTEVGDPGTESGAINVGGVTYNTKFTVNDIGGSLPGQMLIHRHSTTWFASLLGVRSNSDTTSHGVITGGQELFRVQSAGWTGTHYDTFTNIKFFASSSGTISGTSSPGRMEFLTTPDGSNTPVVNMSIEEDGIVNFTNQPTGILHDSLSDYVADEHVPHSSITLTAGTGLDGGGDITTSRTFDLADTAVTPATYGSATQVGQFTVDQQGRITSASDVAIAITSSAVSDFNEAAQDAVGGILTDSATINFTYDDGANTITAVTIDGGIDHNALLNTHNLTTDIDHDATTNFVAAEHVDHTAVTITAGDGLSYSVGGTDISASATIDLDINELTVDTAIGATDTIPMYDGANKKIAFSNFESSLTVDNLGTSIGAARLAYSDGSNLIGDANLTYAAGFGGILQTGTLTLNSNLTIDTDVVEVADDVHIKPDPPLTNMPYAFLIDAAGTNEIVNPKFESNITDGWTNFGTAVTRARTTSEAWIGAASLNLEVASPQDAGLETTTAIAVSENVAYVLSAYVKGEAGGEQPYIGIVPNGSGEAVYNVDQGLFAGVSITDIATTEWTRITLPWTCPSGQSITEVDIQIGLDPGSGTQEVYFDAIQFEQIDRNTDTDRMGHPSSFMSGDMGNAYSWSGDADNSSSSRTGGMKFLNSVSDSDYKGNFLVRNDGSIARAYFDAKEIHGSNVLEDAWDNEPFYPFTFHGDIKTNANGSGISIGVAEVRNSGDGNALAVYSKAVSASALIVSAPDLTDGNCVAIFAPQDLSSFTGSFLTFAGKDSNAEMYQFKRDTIQFGNKTFNYDKDFLIYGGGGMTDTSTGNLSGTLSVTSGGTTVNGTGTSFFSDLRPGDIIIIDNGAQADAIETIESIQSNTQLTLAAGCGAATNASRTYSSFTRQYSPSILNFQDNYAGKGTSVAETGYFYGLHMSGNNGQLRVLKGSTFDAASMPTDDYEGWGVRMSKFVENADEAVSGTTETDIVNGYTIEPWELRDGAVLKINFTGIANMDAASNTITFRVKLGTTTILTSTAVQAGSANDMLLNGEIIIVGTGNAAQRVSISVNGKATAATAATPTYALGNYGTSSVNMVQTAQALSVTAQLTGATSSLDVHFSTVEAV